MASTEQNGDDVEMSLDIPVFLKNGDRVHVNGKSIFRWLFSQAPLNLLYRPRLLFSKLRGSRRNSIFYC